MAKFINIHQISGKVGDKVYCRGKGSSSYVRSLGIPKNEPSIAQLNCRFKLKMAVEFLNPLRQLLEACWTDSSARKEDGFNGAAGYFIKNAFTGIYPELQINYEEVRFSKGRLAWPADAKMVLDNHSVLVSWKNFGFPMAWPDDEAIVVLYNEEYNVFRLFRNSAIREQEYAILQLSEEFARGTLYGYLFFCNYTGKLVSKTLYLGKVTAAGTGDSIETIR